uniref:Coat protein n=1 Tax=Pistacia cryptic virus TaxID=2794235 RepID=A0A7T0M821_9VIRU|nr:coat protein [Pistacia cryptic virus]
MSPKGSNFPAKRPRFSFQGSTSAPDTPSAAGMEIVSVGHPSDHVSGGDAAQASSLIPRYHERLSLTINPNYLQLLTADGTLGFDRLPGQRMPSMRYYTIDLDVFTAAISNVMTSYLTLKLIEQGKMTQGQVTNEVAIQTPVIVNACVSALYAKLRNIHKSFGTYAARFNAPATYSKDIELPLPLADAIQNFGVFNPNGTLNHYVCVPVYPEGVQNEGRSTQLWQSYQYEAYIPVLKSLGIPVKSVDTRIKSGSAWWTYRPQLVDGHYDFRCIFPPSNYSEHSAVLASIFLVINDDDEPIPLIAYQADDVNYPVRLREVPAGFQLRAFSALCHAPSEEWNQYLLID